MKQHTIFLGDTLDSLSKVAQRGKRTIRYLEINQKTTLSEVRDQLLFFQTFSLSEDVLFVDVSKFKTLKYYSPFLKLLEDPDTKGVVWFYGEPGLFVYPYTIRGRCAIAIYPKIAESGKALKDNKEPLTDFLFSLHSADRQDFYTLMVLSKNLKPIHVKLFVEWLNDNPVFSKRELTVCKFLKTDYFKELLYHFMMSQQNIPEWLIFPFIISFRMARWDE